MAAPSSEFLLLPLGHFISESDIKNGRIGTYDATLAVLKTRYYLDFIFGIVEYDASGNEIPGRTGFIGGCFVGSNNYYMHNQNRIWSVASLTNNNEVVFNDAGKNTLGRVFTPLGDDKVTVVNDEIGVIELQAPFRSAWWVNTSKQGFEWKTPGFANTTNNFGSQVQATTATKNRVLNDNDQTNQIAGATFEVRAWVENPEGKWVGEWVTFLIKPRQMVLKYNNQYASSAFNGITTRTVYVGTPALGVGTLFYKAAAMGEADAVDVGYYTDAEFWYQVAMRTIDGVSRSQVVATGPATASGWPPTDPAYDSGARVRQDAWYDSSGFATPCNNEAQNYLPNRTIWRSTFNDVYYTLETGGAIVANGWYVWGGIWHNIQGGIIQGTGSCPNPN